MNCSVPSHMLKRPEWPDTKRSDGAHSRERAVARIALDVMGTDRGPAEIVAGALMAAEAGHEVVLVGRQEVVEPELIAAGADLEVIHAPEVVEMHDDPAKAVRTSRDPPF